MYKPPSQHSSVWANKLVVSFFRKRGVHFPAVWSAHFTVLPGHLSVIFMLCQWPWCLSRERMWQESHLIVREWRFVSSAHSWLRIFQRGKNQHLSSSMHDSPKCNIFCAVFWICIERHSGDLGLYCCSMSTRITPHPMYVQMLRTVQK